MEEYSGLGNASSPLRTVTWHGINGMNEKVSTHYSSDGSLADKIACGLRSRGLEPSDLNAADLESIDEFHFCGRAATLELLAEMKLAATSNVLDIGSGLGGVARTIADVVNCQVTGIDLTAAFCDAATAISRWVNLADKTEFQQGDATNLPFSGNQFDRTLPHWRLGYIVVDRVGVRVTRDPFTLPGFVKLFVHKRVGGATLDTNAIKLQKVST